MKRTHIFLLLALLLSLCGCGEKGAETDAPQAVSGSGKDEHRAEDGADSAWAAALDPAPRESSVLLRQTRYAADGSVISWVDYESHADGRMLKSVPHTPGGSSADGDVICTYEYTNGYLTARTEYNAVSGERRYRYKYDADGNEVKWILYGEDGAVSMWYEDGFDEHGHVVSHVLYRPGEESSVMNLREYDCDEHGNPTECRYVNEAGTVLTRYTYRNVYDEQGRLIECKQTDVGGSVLVDWYRYRYDEGGRLAEEQLLDAGARCIIRTRYLYDAAGRLSRKEYYSSDGQLAVITENLWA